MPKKSHKEFIYRIDEFSRIDFVNNAWLQFANENDAINLKRENVLNKYIMDFISGRETKHIFEILFKRIRLEKSTIKIPFRCDSPDLRRFMHLEMSSGDQKHIEFKSWLIREEKRQPIKFLNEKPGISAKLLRMCSWCKKINIRGEKWEEVEDAIKMLDIFGDAPLPQFTHTVCKPCTEIILLQMDAEKGKK